MTVAQGLPTKARRPILSAKQSHKSRGAVLALSGVDLEVDDGENPLGLWRERRRQVILGMWLATHPRVLIADEPTAGIDAATKERLAEMLLISSDQPAVHRLADRILAIQRGRLLDEPTCEAE